MLKEQTRISKKAPSELRGGSNVADVLESAALREIARVIFWQVTCHYFEEDSSRLDMRKLVQERDRSALLVNLLPVRPPLGQIGVRHEVEVEREDRVDDFARFG